MFKIKVKIKPFNLEGVDDFNNFVFHIPKYSGIGYLIEKTDSYDRYSIKNISKSNTVVCTCTHRDIATAFKSNIWQFLYTKKDI
jgi:hypothetical protein